MSRVTISAGEIDALAAKLDTWAKAQGVTSVHAFKVCRRHLSTARIMATDTARLAGLAHAHTHFQFAKAAAAEKAGR